MKTLLIAGAALLLAGSATSAFAGDKAKARYDHNGDGQLSAQEMQTKKVAKLMRWDRDGDGRVSRGEYQAMMERRAASGRAGKPGKDKFAKFDLNRDGFVTGDEIAERAARKFGRMDNRAGYDGAGYDGADQAPMDDGAR